MMCYKDMTFCEFDDCRHWNVDCHRTLNKEVRDAARKWWGTDNAPISIFMNHPDCFQAKTE